MTKQTGGYCGKCGEKLKHIGYTDIFSFYNQINGKKTPDLEVWECPNNRWWNTGHVLFAREKDNPTGIGIEMPN